MLLKHTVNKILLHLENARPHPSGNFIMCRNIHLRKLRMNLWKFRNAGWLKRLNSFAGDISKLPIMKASTRGTYL